MMDSFQSKPHYEILDGLRGVAALMVLVFHVFDACQANVLPHGYLAVDFFFVLSGFVIGYSYDDRWERGLTVGGFLRRRLIRLHPMVVCGAVVGCLCFLAAGGVKWDGTPVSMGWTLLALLGMLFMVPALPGWPTEVRGFGEFFPLNGPYWSLFYEYIGNVLYALLLRRLSCRGLALVAFVSGCLVVHAATGLGYLGVGWSAADGGWWQGLVRMLFPYSMGMLMARRFRPVAGMRGTFWWSSLILVCVGLLPQVGGERAAWINGLVDSAVVILLFPGLVWLAASDLETSERASRVSRWLGDLSYPLYAVHYPFMSLFFFYLGFGGELLPMQKVFDHWPMALLPLCAGLVLAWLLMKYYDKPLRRWLTRRFSRDFAS